MMLSEDKEDKVFKRRKSTTLHLIQSKQPQVKIKSHNFSQSFSYLFLPMYLLFWKFRSSFPETCMCLWMCKYGCICMWIVICLWMYMCLVCDCACVFMCMCVWVYVYVCVCFWQMLGVNVHVWVCMCVVVHVSAWMYMWVYMCECVWEREREW